MPESQTFSPPSKFLLLAEGRAVYELASTVLSLPLLQNQTTGDGHPVMALPGFIASDYSTGVLRGFLQSIGFKPHRWRQGRNLGPRPGLEERLMERLERLNDRYGEKVSLVGWSLGGIFSRLLANRAPERVRCVITLGSPFAGDPRANHSWRLFERLSGSPIDAVDAKTLAQFRQPPPVPSTAIYSRGDGIADWRCCIDPKGHETENVEVKGSHCGLGCNPLVLHVIADRLAQPQGAWQPFERRGWRRLLYRSPKASPQPTPETVAETVAEPLTETLTEPLAEPLVSSSR